MTLTAKLNVKACAQCGKEFMPVRPMQQVCSSVCASRLVRADKKEKNRQIRIRKESIKTIPTLLREAQYEFNAYIRARDAGKPCICCGMPLGEGEVGGAYDCGHYRSVGSAPHLRFDERNAHAQRKQCNRWGAGRAVDYRIGLIQRIGLEQVEALESDNRVRKWKADELRAIKAEFRRKRKFLNEVER